MHFTYLYSMNTQWNFWETPLLNGTKIKELNNPVFSVAANWVNEQIKDLENPILFFKEKKTISQEELLSISLFASKHSAILEGIDDANYKVECTVRSILMDCIIDLKKQSFL